MKQFELYAFNVLYEHVHLILQPTGKHNISKIIKSLKENTSRDLNYIIANRHHEGDTSTCRLRLREEIKKYRKTFIDKYGINQCIVPQFKWPARLRLATKSLAGGQKSFYDHVIRNENDLRKHYNYTVYNHLKHACFAKLCRGLPENWEYNSLNFKNMIDEMD